MRIVIFDRDITVWRILWGLSFLVIFCIISPVLLLSFVSESMVKLADFVFDKTWFIYEFLRKVLLTDYFRSRHQKIILDSYNKWKEECNKDL